MTTSTTMTMTMTMTMITTMIRAWPNPDIVVRDFREDTRTFRAWALEGLIGADEIQQFIGLPISIKILF
jgi:hypothetical protein